MYKTILRLTVGIALALSIGMSVCYAQGVNSDIVKDKYPYLSLGALSKAFLVALPKGVVLRSGELKLTQKDLDEEIRNFPEEIRPQLKKNLFFVLENKAVRSLITLEATTWAKNNGKGGLKDDAAVSLFFNELTGKISVSDEELKTFFEKNKELVGNEPFEKIKDDIRNYLADQKRKDAIDAHINSLNERAKIEVDKDWTAKQNNAAINNPVDKARSAGKPFLVEFTADYCQACKQMAPVINSIKKKYANKLSVLVVDVKKEPILGVRYGSESIPLQVYFDKDGKEVFRNVGYSPQESVEGKLAEMGIK